MSGDGVDYVVELRLVEQRDTEFRGDVPCLPGGGARVQDDMRLRAHTSDDLGGVESTELRHVDVEQDEVRFRLANQVDRLVSVPRLTDHVDRLDEAEQGPEQGPHARVVVSKYDGQFG